MYNFKRSLIALLGLLLLIGVVAAITPFKGYGQQSPEAPTATQNVFVVNPSTNPVQTMIVNGTAAPVPTRDVDAARGSNIVTLTSSATPSFKRVFADGTIASSEFVVPTGQVLIVTDVEFGADVSSPNYANIILSVTKGANTRPVYFAHLLGDASGLPIAHENMATGFAAAAGAKIEWDYEGAQSSIEVFLRGYLVPAS